MPSITTINHEEFSSAPSDLAAHIRLALDSEGCLLIKDFPADPIAPEISARRFEELCRQVGEPISHDAHGTIVWDIKSRATAETGVITYSEHNHEAEMHTDSQYSEYPEDFFGLLTLQPAECGGGESMLLWLEDILRELRELPDGACHEQMLRHGNYPFLVPKVFQRENGDTPEYNAGPILRDTEIRFRVDTLEKALMAYPDLCSAAEKRAYEALKEIVLNSPSIQRFHLERGDLIFINNKTMLHGRTAFTDARRHLLRVRMNRVAA
jgi:alpha-ketoglutarate-dependent taurine dioxygenase